MLTQSEITAKLTPHIGAKLAGAHKYAVEIVCGKHRRLDADIREIDEAGVGVFFYSGIERIPFAAITEIKVTLHWFWVEQQGLNAARGLAA